MRSPVCSKLVLFLFIVTLALMVAPASFAAVTGTIHGMVKNQETGAPIRSALVQLFQPGVPSAVSFATTDAGGNYVITAVTPGAYNITATSQSFQGVTSPVNVVQDESVIEDFNLILQVHTNSKTTRIIVSQVQRSQTSSTYNVTERDEQEREPNPTASYQYPGLVVGVPGVTFDPGAGYVHLRGSDQNSVSFQQDGIPLVDSLDGEFTTNIVSVGLKDANVDIGGQNADSGGDLGGSVNEVTKTGRDLVSPGQDYGGMISTELGPGHGWNYTGSQDEFGGTLAGGKADYYLSTVVFRNRFPENFDGLTNLPDSYDGIYKFDLYPDKNNTLSFYYGKGNEEYQEAEPGNAAAQENIQLNWKTQQLVDKGLGFADEEMQGYQNTYLSVQHKFNPQSYITYKFDYNPENVDVYLNGDAPNVEGVFEHLDYHKFVHDLDYQNQFSTKFTLAAGYQYIPEHDRELEAIYTPSVAYQDDNLTNYPDAISVQNYGGQGSGYYTPSSDITTDRNAFYLNGQIKPMGEKLTMNLGTRFESMEYQTHNEGNFTKKAVNPRLGIVYSPSRTTAIHAAADTTSQFADARRVEFVSSFAGGFGSYDTMPGDEDAVLASRYTPSEPDAEEQNNYEVGITQGFSVLGGNSVSKLFTGNYNFLITTYQQKMYNLLDYTRAIGGSEAGGYFLHGPRSYDSNGTGHSSGVEMELSKPARNRADQAYNGFVTYTNATVRRTSSFLDSAYIPYFANAFEFVPGITQAQFAQGLKTEYAPSWDQKHTVYAELNKRVGKVVNFHLNLDSGSGYPFIIGVSALAAAGGGEPPSVDSQHTYNNSESFATVPVVLPNGSLQPLNATPGRTGWHYKFGLNTDFDITPKMSLYLETDNILDRKTTTIYSTVDAYGNLYYHNPTYAHPQGQVYYGPNTILLPEYIAFGARLRF